MSVSELRASPATYGNIRAIRALIWIYFFLLIFEGFLRMLLPGASNVLLVARDPFLLAAYAIAWLSGVFPWNRYVIMLWLLGAISVIMSFQVLPHAPMVILYGFRASFLHVPLIFLIPQVMDEHDVVAFGRWFLILSIPVAILMVMQFQAGPDSWLNRGVDNQFTQIISAKGKIRPPGTFSYVTGPVLFYAYVVAFLMYDQFQRGRYPKALIVAAAGSTCLALAVSGSRSALSMAAVVVLAATIAVIIAKPKAMTGLVKFAFVVAIALFATSQLSVFGEGVDVMSARVQSASNAEGGFQGFVDRAFGSMTQAFDAAPGAELTGAGLGVGTNAGAALLGRSGFLLAENEWPRMVLEMGPVAGFCLIGMRLGLVVWMLMECIGSAKRESMLPILLFGACGLGILYGQWGQATELGFAVLGGGLCLASIPRTQPSAGREALP